MSIESDVNEEEERQEKSRGAYIGNRVSSDPILGQKGLFCEQKKGSTLISHFSEKNLTRPWFNSYESFLGYLRSSLSGSDLIIGSE